jgi:hypothetical protein
MVAYRPKHAQLGGARDDRKPARGGVGLVVLGCLLLVAAGVLYLAARVGHVPPEDAGTVPAAFPPPAFPTAEITTGAFGAGLSAAASATTSAAASPRPRAEGSRPLRVRITGDVPIDARVVPVHVEHQQLGVPENPRTLGWFTGGAKAGASAGTVLIDGHVDSAQLGLGALFHLAEVPMGTRVTVSTAAGAVRYKIVARRLYKKAVLPQDIFAVDGAARLVLITCGGPFDRSALSYRDNVVVYGVPI